MWALGALIGLIGLAASVARVRGLKRRSSPLDGTLADELPWLTEVGPGREIYLRLSYETETPVAIGFRRPVILIPTELATADGLGAIESLILHEHAHLRRNDDWTNLLQRTIERVFWFNPIVWFVGRRIALEREIASDDAVVEKTGEAHAYATSLWKLAREMRMPEHAVVAPGALLTRKQITVRIEQLLDKKRARLHRSPVAALGVLLAGVCPSRSSRRARRPSSCRAATGCCGRRPQRAHDVRLRAARAPAASVVAMAGAREASCGRPSRRSSRSAEARRAPANEMRRTRAGEGLRAQLDAAKTGRLRRSAATVAARKHDPHRARTPLRRSRRRAAAGRLRRRAVVPAIAAGAGRCRRRLRSPRRPSQDRSGRPPPRARRRACERWRDGATRPRSSAR